MVFVLYISMETIKSKDMAYKRSEIHRDSVHVCEPHTHYKGANPALTREIVSIIIL